MTPSPAATTSAKTSASKRAGGFQPNVFGMVNAELVIALNDSRAISRRAYLLRISNRQFPNKFQIQDQISTAESPWHIRNRE